MATKKKILDNKTGNLNSLVTANNNRVNTDNTGVPNATWKSATSPSVFAGQNLSNDPNANNNQSVSNKMQGRYVEGKGFEAANGQTYPTNNPNFRPDVNSTQIKFNEDGSVDLSPRGTNEKITLSKDQYSDLNKTKMGKGKSFDPAVQQAQNPVTQEQQQALNQGLTTEQQNREVVPKEPLWENIQTGAGALAGGLAGAGTGAA